MENRTKPNGRLFADYLSIIKASKSYKWSKETERLLGQFYESIGEFPPTLGGKATSRGELHSPQNQASC